MVTVSIDGRLKFRSGDTVGEMPGVGTCRRCGTATTNAQTWAQIAQALDAGDAQLATNLAARLVLTHGLCEGCETLQAIGAQRA